MTSRDLPLSPDDWFKCDECGMYHPYTGRKTCQRDAELTSPPARVEVE